MFIDLHQAENDLDRNEIEQLALTLSNEIKSGQLVEEAALLREEEVPDDAKPGATAFVTGILTAEISRANLGKLIGWLINRFYGKTLKFSYEDADGTTVSFEYRNEEEFKRAMLGTERLSMMRLQIRSLSDKRVSQNE
ncbi:MAG: hypothetical protein AAFZ17_03205 [Cyanobacteria bacterium J06650_10]